ncbi:Cobalamin-independent methionine synthase MetE, C-terminal/archaeal [Phytophthora cactorum]|nr:Cobalamin-independent methionine synthase MetE, C-terminal/archaeal [Phytophthora cactorum]
MCYCEFSDCMHAIDAIDADVNSIENARSDDETIRSFKAIGYKRDLGPARTTSIRLWCRPRRRSSRSSRAS